jgi:hypothetical protein
MEFVSKAIAVILKEKGFFEACFGWYYIKNPIGEVRDLILNKSTRMGQSYQSILKLHFETYEKYATANIALAPTIDQVLKWLREEKNIHVTVNTLPSLSKNFMCKQENHLIFDVRVSWFEGEIFNYYDLDEPWFDYEDACIAGIGYAIDNLI